METSDGSAAANAAGQTPEIATIAGSGGVIAEIGWIRFPKSGKQALAGSDDSPFCSGDLLLVRTDRGDILARALTDSERKVHLPADFVKVVRRIPKDEEKSIIERDEARAHEARLVFVDLVRKHSLDMHLSEVEVTHGDARIVFYFTAPGRVDFRALVRELAGALKSRIELRQIGVRDEARCTGGLGPCGLPLCCSTFLREFTTVTIRMAKVQGLVPNPQKVSGLCGRLMCCLAYEHGVYTDMMKDLPKTGSTVQTPKGEGRVKEVLVMRSVIKVALGPGVVEEFSFEQLGLKCQGCCASHATDEEAADDVESSDSAGGQRERHERRDRRPQQAARGNQQRDGQRGQGQGSADRPDREPRDSGQPRREGGAAPAQPRDQGEQAKRHRQRGRRPDGPQRPESPQTTDKQDKPQGNGQ